MRRGTIITVVLGGVLAACVPFRGGPNQQNVAFYTSLSPDSALRIASTTLQANGYDIGARAENTVYTRAKTIPNDAHFEGLDKPARNWMLRVDAVRDPMSTRTQVIVLGYAMPEMTARPNEAAGASDVDVVPITAAHRTLFGHVQTAANMIRTATEQKRRK